MMMRTNSFIVILIRSALFVIGALLWFGWGAAEAARLPDLSISNRDVSIWPDPPACSQSFEVRMVIRNKGRVDAENVDVCGQIKQGEKLVSESQGCIKVIRRGSSAQFTAQFGVLPKGGYNLLVKVDPKNQIKEEIESNNSATLFVRVHAPDLYLGLGCVSISPTSPRFDDEVKAKVRLENRGKARATNALLVLRLIHGSKRTEIETTISSLSAGLPFTKTFNLGTLSPGSYKVEVEVDPKKEIEEERENNNKTDRTFYVKE